MIMYLTGVNNIRDVIPFARTVGHANLIIQTGNSVANCGLDKKVNLPTFMFDFLLEKEYDVK